MTFLVPKPQIRELETRINALPVEPDCAWGGCSHDHSALRLPPGTRLIVATDRDQHPNRHIGVLIRYTNRSIGGYNVVRSDNGRQLGWVVNSDLRTGRRPPYPWSAHVDPSAFRGDTLDDTGDLLDQVPGDFYGAPYGRLDLCPPIDQCACRDDAASSIVWRLVAKHATAVTGSVNHLVIVAKTYQGQHFELGEGRRRHCSCTASWPCPKRATLPEREGVLR